MVKTSRYSIAVIVCTALMTTGCATAGPRGVVVAPFVTNQDSTNRRVLAEYVQKLPPGTEVRVGRSNGHSLRGTLIKGTDQSIFIQPKTRLPEPLVEIPLSDVLEVTPERRGGSGIGRAIGAGAAAGAAATVTILLILIAAVD